jgi:hypothetical protein
MHKMSLKLNFLFKCCYMFRPYKADIVRNHNKPYINSHILNITEHGRRNKNIA